MFSGPGHDGKLCSPDPLAAMVERFAPIGRVGLGHFAAGVGIEIVYRHFLFYIEWWRQQWVANAPFVGVHRIHNFLK